jgi:hypothetical protein
MERAQYQHHNPTPSLFCLFTSFLRLGATAFGGPAMVAYIRKMAVEKKHWLDDQSARDGSSNPDRSKAKDGNSSGRNIHSLKEILHLVLC